MEFFQCILNICIMRIVEFTPNEILEARYKKIELVSWKGNI